MNDVGNVVNLESLLTLSATASLLNVSPSTIGRWGRDGSLPSVVLRRGRRKTTRRFRQEDIARLVNSGSAAQMIVGDAR
jgi:predicted site-specific integrase-resolvase